MYPIPENEQDRLHQLWQYRIVGTRQEKQFDQIAELAAKLFAAPMVAITFVDSDRLWLKARVGLDVCETPRDVGFCTHAIMHAEPMIVADTLGDDRFVSNPLVQAKPCVRFYAGAPLIVAGGLCLGTLCIMDTVARRPLLTEEKVQLETLASLIVARLELRRLEFVDAAIRGFVDATSEAFLCIDAQGILTFVNRAALDLFNYPADKMVGQKLDLIVPERFKSAHAAGVARIAGGTASRLAGKTIELSAVRRGGEEFPIEMGICVWQDQHGMQMGAVLRDITERKERDVRLHRLASHDGLTGLANRSQVDLALVEAFSSGPVGLLLLDLDGFKGVNDSLGHAAGDALLQALSVRMQAALDVSALLGRMGGDEFIVVLPGKGDPLHVAECAETILSAFETPVVVLDHKIQIGLSIGAAIGPSQGCDGEELIASADLALYRAKAEGGRRFRLYEPTMRNAVQARRALRDELRGAVECRELVLHYQPVVELQTRRVIGAEALLRWQHPERGLLLPGAFIQTLEGHALAVEAGSWILDEACRQAASWRQTGSGSFRMCVNLFAAQIRSKSLIPAIVSSMAQYGISAAELELEITETIALQNDEAVLRPLRAIRKLGVGLSFDDFGTGYASLSTLKRVPLTTLKIDRSFVRDLHTDAHDFAVVEAVVGMGRRLGLAVIAEGIETLEQEALLMRLGCRSGQGFLYGRAVPADSFGKLLQQQKAAKTPPKYARFV